MFKYFKLLRREMVRREVGDCLCWKKWKNGVSREVLKFLLVGGDNTFNSLLDIVLYSSMEDVSIDVADNAVDMLRQLVAC